MNTVTEVMAALKKLGSEQTRKTFARHGAPVDQMYGVKVGDLKSIVKKIKGNQKLAMALLGASRRFAGSSLERQESLFVPEQGEVTRPPLPIPSGAKLTVACADGRQVAAAFEYPSVKWWTIDETNAKPTK